MGEQIRPLSRPHKEKSNLESEVPEMAAKIKKTKKRVAKMSPKVRQGRKASDMKRSTSQTAAHSEFRRQRRIASKRRRGNHLVAHCVIAAMKKLGTKKNKRHCTLNMIKKVMDNKGLKFSKLVIEKVLEHLMDVNVVKTGMFGRFVLTGNKLPLSKRAKRRKLLKHLKKCRATWKRMCKAKREAKAKKSKRSKSKKSRKSRR